MFLIKVCHYKIVFGVEIYTSATLLWHPSHNSSRVGHYIVDVSQNS